MTSRQPTALLDPTIAEAITEAIHSDLANTTRGMTFNPNRPNTGPKCSELLHAITHPAMNTHHAPRVITAAIETLTHPGPNHEHATREDLLDMLLYRAATHPHWYTHQQIATLTTLHHTR